MGRIVFHDLADNGLLDASVIYGVNSTVEALMFDPPATPPFLRLTVDQRIPLICPGVPKQALFDIEDTACCGACSEDPGVLALYTLLFREHNAVARRTRGGPTAQYDAGKERIMEILTTACPGCVRLQGDNNRLHILMLALSTSYVQFFPEATGNVDPASYCDLLKSREQLGKIGRRLPAAVVGRVECFDLNQTEQFGLYNGSDVMGMLLGERHGPEEDDVLGPLGRSFWKDTMNSTGPLWFYNSAADDLVDLYCPTITESSGDSSPSNCQTTEGSLIFFTILFGALVVILIAWVGVKVSGN